MKARVIRDVYDELPGEQHHAPIGTVVTLACIGLEPGTIEVRDAGWFYFDELEPLDHGAVEACVAASEAWDDWVKGGGR